MSTVLHEPTQAELDAALEQRIAQARVTLDAAQSQDERREAHEHLRWLILQRQTIFSRNPLEEAHVDSAHC